MLDTFHPLGVVTRIRFIKNRVCCGVWPAVPIVKIIGTWIWATPDPGKAILKFDASGSFASFLPCATMSAFPSIATE
jgi:hypothetical protein